jgi:hypothetical protein
MFACKKEKYGQNTLVVDRKNNLIKYKELGMAEGEKTIDR